MLKYLQDDYKSLTKAINLFIKRTKEAQKILNPITWTQFKKNKIELTKKKNLCNNLILFVSDYLKEFKDLKNN